MLFSIVSNVISVSSVTCNQCLKCQVSDHKISKNLTLIVDEFFLSTIVDENFLSKNCRWNCLSTIVDEIFLSTIVDEFFLSTIEIVEDVEVIVEVVEVIVEVMGVVEVMEVTLLFVEVTSLQKSKSLTDFSTIEFNFNNAI